MVEKTSKITVDGKDILIDSLPKELRDRFALWDRMREDMEDAQYRYNVLLIAITAFKKSLETDVENLLMKPKDKEVDSNDG